jgi:outer membrane protein assembly factor BamB
MSIEERGLKRGLLVVVSLAVMLHLGALEALANPWSMFQRDNKHRGRALVPGPDSLAPAFKIDLDGITEGAPVVAADGTIYIGNHSGRLLAFDPSGALKWSYKTLSVIRGTPLIGTDGTIYVGSKDGGLYAINPDGTLKWVFYTGNSISSSPSISNDGKTIYFGTYRRGVYAVGTDGMMKWHQLVDMAISAPSPAVAADGTIYIGGYGQMKDGLMYAFNADGTIKWRREVPGPVRTTVAIGTDGTLYFGTRNGRLYAVNPDSTIKWTFSAGDEIRASAAIDTQDGTIYFGSYDKKLYAINPDGTLKWSYDTNGYIEASPIVDARGVVYVKPHSGFIYAVNRDGTTRGRYAYGYISSGMSIDANGVLYFCGDFTLIAIGPLQPPPPPNPTHPTVELKVAKDVYFIGDTLNINATLANETNEVRAVELKVYMSDSQQNLISIVDTQHFTLNPGEVVKRLVYSHTFTASEPSTILYIGARVMTPETGDTLSLDFRTVSFQAQ